MLQVDDNMVNRRVATSMLSRYGATVISSNSGLEAVVAVKNQQAGMEYDLILMDIQMPEVNFFCNLKNKTCLVLLICTLSASCMHTKYMFLSWLLTLNS
jgi:CheY-like chemotaxis protein